MSTHLDRLPNRKRLGAIVLAASITLLAPALGLAAPQQSSTPSTPSQSAAPAQPNSGAAATNRGVVNSTNRNQVATRPDAVVSTRSITDAWNAGTTADATTRGTAGAATTTFDLTAQQRLAMQQQLASMDTRLDTLLAMVNSSTGTQRDQALATVVQELASQISAMRQALLASGFSSFDRLADGQTIFLTPSNVLAEDRRQNGLDSTTTIAGRVPTITNTQAQPAVPASSMSIQAQSRRGQDPGEPVVAPD